MHTTLKNAALLKHSKLEKNAPTCFGLHRNHLQGAKVSAWLKITRLVDSICVKDVQDVVSAMEFGVGAFLSNLECFNNSTFFNVMCISW